jgi:hypothetical protein
MPDWLRHTPWEAYVKGKVILNLKYI